MSSRYDGFVRTTNASGSYGGEAGARAGMYDKTYIGFVKDNVDVQKMGRMRVWIPEICGHPADETKWITVSTTSFFAGASNPHLNVDKSKVMNESQMAYGWWGTPPDLDNEVVVQFVNGDPNRGIVTGYMWQQNMNHSVPGNAINSSHQGGACNVPPPVVEYNKKDYGQQPDRPIRPRFEPLHTGLYNEGLYPDPERGPTNASARRESPSQVYGLRTPRGHQLYIDDGEIEFDQNGRPVFVGNEIKKKKGTPEYIRMRTRGGTQVLINDTAGYVYINSKRGNSWLEISDDGINAYTLKDYNIRAQGNMNVRVDGDYNLEVLGKTNWRNVGDVICLFESQLHIHNQNVTGFGGETGIRILTDASYNLYADENIHVEAGKSIHNTAGASCFTTAETNINTLAGSNINNTAGASLNSNAGSSINEAAPVIHNNTAEVADAPKATPSAAPLRLDPAVKQDAKLTAPCFPRGAIDCKSIIPQESIVSHEPWPYHPRSTGINSANSSVSKTTGTNGHVVKRCETVTTVTTGSGQTVTKVTDPTPVDGPVSQTVPTAQAPEPGAYNIKNITNPVSGLKEQVMQMASGFNVTDQLKSVADRILDTEGFNFIKGFEEFAEKPIKDLAGQWTVGYGQKISEAEREFYEQNPITKEQAEDMLKASVQLSEQTVKEVIKVPTTQSQYNSMVSLAYNLGSEQFKSSEIVSNFNKGDVKAAVESVKCYSSVETDGGVESSQAVKNRREKEQNGLQNTPNKDGSKGAGNKAGFTPDANTKTVNINGYKVTPEIANAIYAASAKYGVDPGYMMAMAAQESSFNPNAKADTSSAAGMYQFIDGTWEGMVNKYGKQTGIKMSDRYDINAQATMAALYAKENQDKLSGLGRPLSSTDLYLGHFLGGGGASTFLSANPNATAADVLPKAAGANKTIFYVNGDKNQPRTVEQVYKLMQNKIEPKANAFKDKFGSGNTPNI